MSEHAMSGALGGSNLEREAALRRALLRSARHGEAGVSHFRTDERIAAVRRIVSAPVPPRETGATSRGEKH